MIQSTHPTRRKFSLSCRIHSRPRHVVVLDQDKFYVTFFVNIFVIQGPS
jgi:hypothetical protein